MDLKTRADKYIEGLLSENEKLIFEKEMRNNSEIREYFDRRKLLDKNLNEYFQNNTTENKDADKDIRNYLHNYKPDTKNEETEYKNILKEFSEKHAKKHQLFSKSFLLNMAAAVALFIIIGVGISNKYIHQNSSEKYLNLFAQYFEPKKDLYLPDSQQNIEYLISENFAPTQLSNQFDNIVRSGSYNDISLVYISILLIQKGEEDKALKQLEIIMQNAEPTLSEISRWYYSLLNLKRGKKDISLENLHILCSGTSHYSESACVLIQEIAEN